MPFYEFIVCGVDVRRRLRQRRIKTQRLRQMKDAVDVARQTRTSIRSTSTQQTRSDAWIERQRACHAVEVGAAKPIAQLSQKIPERYLQTEKRVESDLHELGVTCGQKAGGSLLLDNPAVECGRLSARVCVVAPNEQERRTLQAV